MTMYPAYTDQLPNTDPTQLNGQIRSPGTDPDINKQPRVQNWNIGVQFDAGWDTRLEVNYVGNHGDFLNEPRYLERPESGTHSEPVSGGHPDRGYLAASGVHARMPGFRARWARPCRPFPQFEDVEVTSSQWRLVQLQLAAGAGDETLQLSVSAS